MDAAESWIAFCRAQEGFAYTYAAYRHYRLHNWVRSRALPLDQLHDGHLILLPRCCLQVVRSGIKYGTDFVLYRKGPAHYHAEWSVVVQATGEGVEGGQWSAGGRQLSWRSLSTLNRLSEQVAKVRALEEGESESERKTMQNAHLLCVPVGSFVVLRRSAAAKR